MKHGVSHTVSVAEAGQRLDVYLCGCGAYRSRSSAAAAVDSGNVYVGGIIRPKSYRLSEGDVVVCEVEDQAGTGESVASDIPLDIRFEDEDVIVLSKPAGLVVHPTGDIDEGTLVNALVFRYGTQGLCHVQGGGERAGIVHRLDADTSGLMLAAKTDAAGQALMGQISRREVDRRYIALVHGIVVPDSGIIDAPIGRCPKNRKKRRVSSSPDGRDAVTTFRVLARFGAGTKDSGYTMVECKLHTGRTHQIRVHFEYIRHPCVGDPLYSAYAPRDSASSLGLGRQFLHSYRIGFVHPMTGRYMEFSDPLPTELESAVSLIIPRLTDVTDAGKHADDILGLFDLDKGA